MEANNGLDFCFELKNFQEIGNVAKIFSKNRNISTLKPAAGENPVLVIVVGAPGVGKTTKTRRILSEKFKLDYNNFYNVSLDSFVEKIKPYRNTTKKLYNSLQKRISSLANNKLKLNNSAAALLSEFYLPTIMSKDQNFSLSKTVRGITKKINVFGDPIAEKAYKTKKTFIAELAKKEKAAEAAAKKGKAKNAGPLCLNDMLKVGLEYGIENGLNVIYDTTLNQKKNKIKDDIMPILERHKDHKYAVKVILVTPEEDVIKERIRCRHKEMLSENVPYIRAINPKLTKGFIEDNKIGFDKAETYFKTANYKNTIANTPYSSADFEFIEVENPPNIRNNKTKKNKNNNNYGNNLRLLFNTSNNF